jgi:hypothetical protein
MMETDGYRTCRVLRVTRIRTMLQRATDGFQDRGIRPMGTGEGDNSDFALGARARVVNNKQGYRPAGLI